MASEFNTILFEVADKVATITINRPDALNAFTMEMCEEFDQLWKQINTDDGINAVVIRAADGRAFSTGADVKSGVSADQATNPFYVKDPGDYLGPRSNHCWKPVIVAVHGLCCAGGFYFLNQADFVICSDDAQFFDPHVSYGMVCGVEPVGMAYRVPLQEVLRISLMGGDERVSAQTALRINLVSEVVAKTDLWARAHSLASKIAAKPPSAIQNTVRAIWEGLDMPRAAALNHALRLCEIGNPKAAQELDVDAARKAAKTFEIR
ncbi:enoyl-CoA hydratase/isomerase family protein [Zhongshania aliphaticivorans]|jgi:enoyl-CoA hydratase/carnithine racemase|uniref:enoyl-CoA hydratase/isomerase family protein n=1 Tax=Zhongshania aliphaticivorans TaxID=1470434 RepID=UPI0039C93E0A|tara:strand:+ start:1601 stop:2392 length:792 start_codon:yes stop_codon:yes gene_type:complete